MIWAFLFQVKLFTPLMDYNFGSLSFTSIWNFYRNVNNFVYGSLIQFVTIRDELLKAIYDQKWIYPDNTNPRWYFANIYTWYREMLRDFIDFRRVIVRDFLSCRDNLAILIVLLNPKTWDVIPIFVDKFSSVYQTLKRYLMFSFLGQFYRLYVYLF